MPKRQPLQTTFEAGVLSPLMYGRSDLPGYVKSAKRMENMFADTRGPALSRNGFEHLSNIGDPSDKYGRLFTFRVSQTEKFIVAITPTFVWITDASGFLESANKMTNGDFTQDSTGWTVDTEAQGVVTFPSDLCRLESGAGLNVANTGASIEQNVIGLTAINTHIIRIASSVITPGGQMKLEIGTAQGLSDIVDATVGATSEISFTPGVTDIWIKCKVIGTPTEIGTPTDPIFTFVNNVRDIDIITLVDLVTDPDAGFLTFPSPWTEDQLHDVQAEMAPDLQRMYFCHREVPVQQLDVDITVTPRVWTFAETVFDWLPGIDPWETEYPGAITFFQSRLYLAGTVTNPVTIWGSVPGAENYHNFSDAGGTEADDPIKVILARNADIQWMQGSKVLYVGCDNSEHVITSDGPAVINSDIETQQQSAYGSARIKSNWISSKIPFASWDKRRLRLINYDSETRNVDSMDLTFASEHLTRSLITEMHHFPHPVNILWTVQADGTFLSCAFEVDRGIIAWSPHFFAFSTVQSLTISDEQGRSAAYALIFRNNQLRLLRMGLRDVYMDEYVERGYASPTNTVDRLEHLEGMTVQVTGDGNLYPDAVVVGGEIVADGPPASTFIVGLILPRTLETAPVDDIRGGSSSAASKKSWNRIYVRVLSSILPIINGKRPPDRTPATPMNTREPNRSQDVIVQNVGWDYEGTIIISQDLPYDLTITGVYGELTEENL